MQTLTALPDSFAAGTTVKLTVSLADYPANAGWSLDLILVGPGKLNVTSTASGTDHALELTALATKPLPAGSYTWAYRVSKGGEVYQVDGGQVIVTADVVAAGIGELQDPDEKQLAIVEGILTGRLTADTAEAYTIAGRSVNKIPVAELFKIRDKLRTIVARKRSGGSIGVQHVVTFTR